MILNKIMDLITGKNGIVSTVKQYFPPTMTETEKKELENKLQIALMSKSMEVESEFNQRIKDMEGTTSDLKSLPVIGRLIIFLRGCLRPAFGFSTLIWDYQIFSGAWQLQDEITKNAFFLINALVLVFLFGERAFKNIAPIISNYFKSGK